MWRRGDAAGMVCLHSASTQRNGHSCSSNLMLLRRFGKYGYSWVVFVYHVVVKTETGDYIVVKCVMHVFQKQDYVQDTFAATAAYEATLRMLAASKIGKDVTTVHLQSGQCCGCCALPTLKNTFVCRQRLRLLRSGNADHDCGAESAGVGRTVRFHYQTLAYVRGTRICMLR